MASRVALRQAQGDAFGRGRGGRASRRACRSGAHAGEGAGRPFGRYDEALERFEKAIALSTNDPQRWAFYTFGALALIFSGDFERAIEWADHAVEIPNRQYWTLAHKAVALALLGRADEARRVFDAARAEQPALSVGFAREKLFYVKRADQLERYLEGLALAGAAP